PTLSPWPRREGEEGAQPAIDFGSRQQDDSGRSSATTPQPLLSAKRCPVFRRENECAADPMGYAMDGLQTLDIVLFCAGAFAAAFVTGLAGFAFAVVATAVWLHFLPPVQ